MKKGRNFYFSAVFVAFATMTAFGQQGEEVQFLPISIAGQFDNGQVVKGQVGKMDRISKGVELNGSFFQRTGVWITQEAIVKERLHVTVGVGGVFWYSLPTGNTPGSNLTQFGPGISQAQGVYSFGSPENPIAKLQMGFFPYKYNPDAKNLGEYLLRSGTYPGYLVSGGWNMISSAAYMVQGLRLNVPLWDGKAQIDFLLPMEHDIPPMNSVSPTLVATVRPLSGVSVGAGVTCNHCLSPKPSRESPSADGANRIIIGDSLVLDTANNTYAYNFERHPKDRYTYQGLKVMANASLDPKAFVPMPFLGPEDLKLYGEIAVLGWKNYDYMYEKRTERMPIMVGTNLPTFKMLDVLSFELEYYNSKFLNSFDSPLYNQTPWVRLPDEVGDLDTYRAYMAEARRDNWKWSLYAKKSVIKGVQLYAQAARDHIRTFQINGGPEPVLSPITNKSGEWYYLIRLQFGI